MSTTFQDKNPNTPITADWLNSVDNLRTTVCLASLFGVIADGVADDSAALEFAINSCNGKILLLPAGTAASPKIIKITRPLSINSGVSLQLVGFGKDKTIIKLVAASLASDALSFVGSPKGIKVTGITFDQNAVPNTATCGMLGLQNAEDLEISYCSFIGFDRIGVGLQGPRNFSIHHNSFTRTTPLDSFNQAILIGSASQPSYNGELGHNTCVRSAINIDGSNIEIHNNEISAWRFGAGITTEQSINSSRVTIRDNTINSGSGIDVNGYRCGGIENWASYSIITGNRCFNNSGAGIDQGGHHSFVEGNSCYNNGQSGTPGVTAGGDGITSRYWDAVYNANYSTYSGNFCIDSQVNKTQGYGYSDQSASLTSITLRGNKFGSHLTGSELILSALMDHDAPILELSFADNPVNLPAGTFYAVAQTFPNASPGDYVQCTFSLDLQAINLFGYVKVANTIVYVFHNITSGAIDLGPGTVLVRVTKKRGYQPFVLGGS